MSLLGGPELERALSMLYERYSYTVYGVGLKKHKPAAWCPCFDAGFCTSWGARAPTRH